MNVKLFLRSMMLALAALPAMLFAGSAFDRPTVSFYVSPKGNDSQDGSQRRPVKSIAKALALARDVRSDSKREVVVADGLYRLEEPVRVTPEDYEVTVRAEHPRLAVLSGAVTLDGWVTDTNDTRFLVAKLPFKPEKGSVLIFTSSGERRHFSVYPSDDKNKNMRCPATLGAGTNFTRLPYDPSSFPADFDFERIDLESVWLYVQQEWAINRSYIESVDVASHIFNLKTPTNMAIGMYNRGFKVMNSRLGMLQPGDWMYEASLDQVVYWPKEGETAKNLKCEITRLPVLFDVAKAVNFTLSGLVLTGASSTFSGGRGNFRYCAAVSGTAPHALTVENCDIHTSAGHGIAIWKPYTTMIRENHIHHVGGDGIGFWDGGGADNEIRKNEVDHIGVLSLGNTGIYMQLAGIKCIGNKIHDIPGSGMVLWSEHSLIAENDICDVMLTGRDGGGLYGAYDYTVVRDNYCHYTKPSDWPALYADEGSQHTVLTGNRVVGTWWPTHVHCAQLVEVKDNVFKYPGAMRFSFAGSAHCSFTGNKICTSKDVNGAEYLANCDKWADNELYIATANGKYRKTKTLSFDIPKAGQYEAGTVIAGEVGGVRIDGVEDKGEYFGKRYAFERLKDSRAYPGCPSHTLKLGYDGKYLYAYAGFLYAALMPYSGSICKGHGWKAGDAVRLVFGAKKIVTIYADGEVEASDGMTVAKTDGNVTNPNWRHVNFELRIPLTDLGFEPGEEVAGKEIGFNAIAYNCDHYESHLLFSPEGKNVMSGKLLFGARN